MSTDKEKKRKFSLSPTAQEFIKATKKAVLHNWPLKLTCVALSLVLWGVLITSDANLAREKLLTNITVNAVNADVLQRNGLIVVDGLDNLSGIQIKVDVPQRAYNTVTASNYNVRVDLSRITQAGEQPLPIITTQTSAFGQVTWMSKNEITVTVDELMTRRRVPVQLNRIGEAPAGFYAAGTKYDPVWVVVTGPKSIAETIDKCVAIFDLSSLAAQPGIQMSSVPFELWDVKGKVINSSLLTVTSESIILDSLIIDQRLFPMKTVDINLGGITSGQPQAGYQLVSVKAAPSYLSVAGTSDFLRTLNFLEVTTSIDIQGANESLIRAVKVERPQNAEYMSEEVVYVSVEILPESTLTPSPTESGK